ncbi:MAG: 7-carboxy-7-deazaguanine synthase QueE [Gammaproteobacteria bacterium]|nr:MAG: 7-carboxy-7-deazaguanine synthase QueE [Gammaproteobacteria bacterium]RKZ72034.1 MAG: 7-carboxy-7-deazaguanine synthase QueE [Gammaproteobacteria bacterium]
MPINDLTLKINEIFFSIQGETTRAGLPTIFIRLTGCPLRCTYCDTAYAFHDGERMTLAEIMQTISDYKSKQITVTGGEPLAQKNCRPLLEILCDAGYDVSLETSGALNIQDIDNRVARIIDLKTPASGEVDKNLYENMLHLTPQDQVKFVICDREDYEWSKEKLNEYKISAQCEVLFSGSHGEIQSEQLANWILEDQLPVRLQIQLHKYLWGNVPGK